jgi:hypothetical protein
MLCELFPEFSWNVERFVEETEKWRPHRSYFDWAGTKLGIVDLSDWYRVSKNRFLELLGSEILHNHYHSSLGIALECIYSDFHWEGSLWSIKFHLRWDIAWRIDGNLPSYYWRDRENVRRYLAWVARELQIYTDNDWSYVSVKEFKDLKGGPLLEEQGGIYNLLYDFLGIRLLQGPSSRIFKVTNFTTAISSFLIFFRSLEYRII